MKNKIKTIAILPIGPDDPGIDTIESIFLYMDSVHIIAIDDSKNPSTKKLLQNIGERVTILEPRGSGIRGGLWQSLAYAYNYAVENFDFEVLLRIDTDALVIGRGSEEEAINAFSLDPKVGMLGSYKIDCNGDKLPRWIPANVIWRESGIRGYFRNLERRKLLHGWIKLARRNGYRLGEFVQGGSNFQSYACIHSMVNKGFLNTTAIKDSEISEDFIFSLLTVASGYRMADFSTGNFPMGIRWRGLPDSPENLIARKKKIIHSIKFWNDMDQKSIREFFRQQRLKEKSVHVSMK